MMVKIVFESDLWKDKEQRLAELLQKWLLQNSIQTSVYDFSLDEQELLIPDVKETDFSRLNDLSKKLLNTLQIEIKKIDFNNDN